MKITISNGNPDLQNQEFEQYLQALTQTLTRQGHNVTVLTLREMNLHGCTGCFGCWVKTPGECVLKDDGPVLRRAALHADFYLLASPLRMGFPTALLKTATDKLLPLIHPYAAMVKGEVHHRARYKQYPRLGLLLQKETGTDEADLYIVSQIFSRAALNLKTALEFVALTGEPVEELAQKMGTPAGQAQQIPFEVGLKPTVGSPIDPPARLTVFNGSPRGARGNTTILMNHFLEGFSSNPGRSHELYYLNRVQDGAEFQQAFAGAECALVCFPLYVDAMPGQVKFFIENLEPFVGRKNNPPLGFVIQSGFPEALHLRYVERYLQKLASRLGSTYLGTVVKGGVEGIQAQPEQMTGKLYQTFYDLGKTFGAEGRFDPALLQSLVNPERFPGYMALIMKALIGLPVISSYWDSQLKENGVFEQRFARPY